ncbi:Rieske (2Fe-2S) protein [Microcoleus sp. FACHB-1515]|nr:Rieske (2Fe-2S) protein [Microcoleus sp. FACHB-1515]
MERRAFLQWVGIGGLASFLPVAIAACDSNSSSPTAEAESPASNREFEAVGTTEQLQQSGKIDVSVGNEKAIVLRDPDSNNLVAVNLTCTHRGCEVAWQANQSEFVCPCHQAKFKANGEVVEGPAEQPLTTYAVKTEGNSILIQKG